MKPWLARWLRPRRVERELDDEIRFHLEEQIRDLQAEGLSKEEARRRTLASFGGVEPIKAAVRDANGWLWLDEIVLDVKYALRTCRQQPGFAAVAVLILTLGIGANTAVFSVVNAVVLRPLPVPSPHQLVLFNADASQGTTTSSPFPEGRWGYFSTETFDFLRARLAPIASVAAFESGDYTGSARMAGRDENVQAKFVSGNYFDVMGEAPAVGRALTLDDDRPQAERVAVLSDHFWRSHLGADPAAIGRTVVVDSEPVTVVGVMPPEFFGERVKQAPDMWLPIAQRTARVRERTDNYWLNLIARLRDRQTIAGLQAATNEGLHQFLTAQVAPPLSDNTARRIRSVHVDMTSGARGISWVRIEQAKILVLLLAAVSLILLTACANVGTLLLTRAAAREREIAVRRALGASRARLIRQWLTESLLLGSIGAACGVGLAALGAPTLLTLIAGQTREVVHGPVRATIDGHVLAFTLLITFCACLIFGLAPAVQAGRVDPMGSLRSTGRAVRRRRVLGMTEPFVVAQIALSLVLVVAAMLLVRTIRNLEQTPYGFDQDQVLLAVINPRTAGYQTADATGLYRRIYDRAASLPGVDAVTFARFGPFSGHVSTFRSTVEGFEARPDEPIRLDTVQVGPNYAQTLGMPLVEGRAIGFDDVLGAPPVAMVNEAFVARFFAGRRAVGHHFKNRENYEIVGVVKDAQFHTARDPIPPTAFIPMLQETSGMVLDCEIEVRARGDAALLANAVRQAIEAVDPRVTIKRPRTLGEQVRSTFGAERSAAGFMLAFAGLALLVASVGLYGTVSHGLARRTNEIGVRLALGAARSDVLWLIGRETLVRWAIGFAIGAALAQGTGRWLADQLFGVTPRDVVSLAAAGLVLASVVALATIRPALRALRIDPVTALRAE